MYLVMQGVEPSRISILTATQAQADLIQEIIIKKTSWHKSFGKPANVSNLMDSQSLTNDYVILSLVRSQAPGILSEPDATVVALSHARVGLFVLCNLDLFKKLEHFKHVISAVKDKTHKLIAKDHTKDKSILNYEELYKMVQELFQKHQEGQSSN
jgi:intron-binding protein aquarius